MEADDGSHDGAAQFSVTIIVGLALTAFGWFLAVAAGLGSFGGIVLVAGSVTTLVGVYRLLSALEDHLALARNRAASGSR